MEMCEVRFSPIDDRLLEYGHDAFFAKIGCGNNVWTIQNFHDKSGMLLNGVAVPVESMFPKHPIVSGNEIVIYDTTFLVDTDVV